MIATIGKLGSIGLISVLLLTGVSSGPIAFYSTRLEIDPHLHLIPTGPVSVSTEPNTRDYYFFFHSANGSISADHFYRKPGAVKRERLLFLETDHNQVLDRTEKSDEILRGPWGTIFAEKTCFYTRSVTDYSSVSVHSDFRQFDHEIPAEPGPPEKLPPLTSVSLVRIFRADPEYLVVAANYESDGELDSLHIDGAKGGDLVHSSFVPAAQASFVRRIPKDRGSDALERYGVPDQFDIQDYLRSSRLSLPPSALPEEIDVAALIYGYDRVIRRDELKNGAIISSRFLEPSFTDEEKILDPVCDSRFRQQKAIGLPTVE